MLTHDALARVWACLDSTITDAKKRRLESQLQNAIHNSEIFGHRERMRISRSEREKLIKLLEQALVKCRNNLSVLDILDKALLNTHIARSDNKHNNIEVRELLDILIETTRETKDPFYQNLGLLKHGKDKDPETNYLIVQLLYFWEAWLGGSPDDPRKANFVATIVSELRGCDVSADWLRKRIKRQAYKLRRAPRCDVTGLPMYVYPTPGEVQVWCSPPLGWKPPLSDKRDSK